MKAIAQNKRCGALLAMVGLAAACSKGVGVLDDPCFGTQAVLIVPAPVPELHVADSIRLTARLNPDYSCTLEPRFAWTANPQGVVDLRQEDDSAVVLRAVGAGVSGVQATVVGGRGQGDVVLVTVR